MLNGSAHADSNGAGGCASPPRCHLCGTHSVMSSTAVAEPTVASAQGCADSSSYAAMKGQGSVPIGLYHAFPDNPTPTSPRVVVSHMAWEAGISRDDVLAQAERDAPQDLICAKRGEVIEDGEVIEFTLRVGTYAASLTLGKLRALRRTAWAHEPPAQSSDLPTMTGFLQRESDDFNTRMASAIARNAAGRGGSSIAGAAQATKVRRETAAAGSASASQTGAAGASLAKESATEQPAARSCTADSSADSVAAKLGTGRGVNPLSTPSGGTAGPASAGAQAPGAANASEHVAAAGGRMADERAAAAARGRALASSYSAAELPKGHPSRVNPEEDLKLAKATNSADSGQTYRYMSGHYEGERRRLISKKSLSAPLTSTTPHKIQCTRNAAGDAFLTQYADPHHAISTQELVGISDGTMGPLQEGKPRLKRKLITDRVFFGSVVTLPVVHVAKGKGPVTHLLVADAQGFVMCVHVYEGAPGASVQVRCTARGVPRFGATSNVQLCHAALLSCSPCLCITSMFV